jgi:hypothetical protein
MKFRGSSHEQDPGNDSFIPFTLHVHYLQHDLCIVRWFSIWLISFSSCIVECFSSLLSKSFFFFFPSISLKDQREREREEKRT